MFGMIRWREVRHKYTYTVHWQFGDSPSTNSDMWFVSSSTAECIWLPTCLSVSLSVCLSKRYIALGQWPILAMSLPWLKHNFFRDVPKSKQFILVNTKKKMRWWLWTTLVTQVVSASVKCSKGFELEQKKKHRLHVCLSATSLLSALLKIWL